MEAFQKFGIDHHVIAGIKLPNEITFNLRVGNHVIINAASELFGRLAEFLAGLTVGEIVDVALIGNEQFVSKDLERSMPEAMGFRGLLSFGLRHKVHAPKIFELTGDLPMVVEIVDSAEKIIGFLLVVEKLLKDVRVQGLVTREAVRQWTT